MARRAISPEAKKAGAAAFAGAISVAALGLVAVAGPPENEASPVVKKPSARGSVEIQLLGVNDFHGHLESPKSVPRTPGGQPVALGSAAALDSHLDRAAASHPGRTIRVHAGDMVGASPLLSSHFHDEPSVRAMNLMEFDVGTLGNHEFDEGGDELIRLLRGGQRRDGLQFKRDEHGARANTSAPDFKGVRFPYIAANTVDREGELDLPPTRVIERAGVRIGFIGVTTTTTPDYVLSQHAGRFSFPDISDAVNRQAAELRQHGVEAIVVLAHSGARHVNGDSGPARGEIMDEAAQMTGAVDVVIAGHTHSHLNARVRNPDDGGDKLVIEAKSFGVSYDRVRMRVDRGTGDVLSKTGDTPATWGDEVTPDARIDSLVSGLARTIAPLANRVVGRAAHPLLRGRRGAARGSIGALAARAQRRLAGTDFAVVNEGNARGDLDAGPITYAELFRASAYEHSVVRMTLRGADIKHLLDQQLAADPQSQLHVSGPDAGDLDPGRSYTVAANELLVDRGPYEVLRTRARGARPVGTDLQALVRYVEAARHRRLAPGAQSERWDTTLTTVPLGSRSMKRRTPHSSSRRG